MIIYDNIWYTLDYSFYTIYFFTSQPLSISVAPTSLNQLARSSGLRPEVMLAGKCWIAMGFYGDFGGVFMVIYGDFMFIF